MLPSELAAAAETNTATKTKSKIAQSCAACHRDKVKCVHPDGQFKCDRCFKSNRECVARLSLQGRKPKKTRDKAVPKSGAARPALANETPAVAAVAVVKKKSSAVRPVLAIETPAVASGVTQSLQHQPADLPMPSANNITSDLAGYSNAQLLALLQLKSSVNGPNECINLPLTSTTTTQHTQTSSQQTTSSASMGQAINPLPSSLQPNAPLNALPLLLLLQSLNQNATTRTLNTAVTPAAATALSLATKLNSLCPNPSTSQQQSRPLSQGGVTSLEQATQLASLASLLKGTLPSPLSTTAHPPTNNAPVNPVSAVHPDQNPVATLVKLLSQHNVESIKEILRREQQSQPHRKKQHYQQAMAGTLNQFLGQHQQISSQQGNILGTQNEIGPREANQAPPPQWQNPSGIFQGLGAGAEALLRQQISRQQSNSLVTQNEIGAKEAHQAPPLQWQNPSGLFQGLGSGADGPSRFGTGNNEYLMAKVSYGLDASVRNGYGSYGPSAPCKKRGSDSSESSLRDVKPPPKKPVLLQHKKSELKISSVRDLALQVHHAPNLPARQIQPPLREFIPLSQPQQRRHSPSPLIELLELPTPDEVPLDPEAKCANLLMQCLLEENNNVSLRHHFGVQGLIREWIATALFIRSFGLLFTACEMAQKCGIHMDTILCGTDGKSAENSSEERMQYLLSMLLEPRSCHELPIEERKISASHLPVSLFVHVTPSQCSSLGEVQVHNRWITIRESCKGVTKFYCSPMFEQNVLDWTNMTKIYEGNMENIFSLIFANEQYRRFLGHLAKKISANKTSTAERVASYSSMTTIRLLSNSWSQGKHGSNQTVITKEMLSSNEIDSVQMVHVDVMVASIQTKERNVYYLEFFSPIEKKSGSDLPSLHNIVTPNASPLPLPPSYDEVMNQIRSDYFS